MNQLAFQDSDDDLIVVKVTMAPSPMRRKCRKVKVERVEPEKLPSDVVGRPWEILRDMSSDYIKVCLL